MTAAATGQLTGDRSKGQRMLSNTRQSFRRTAAGPGGDLAPSGSGRAHDWTDWVKVTSQPALLESLCERICLICGSEQVVAADALVSVTVLRRAAAATEREVA